MQNEIPRDLPVQVVQFFPEKHMSDLQTIVLMNAVDSNTLPCMCNIRYPGYYPLLDWGTIDGTIIKNIIIKKIPLVNHQSVGNMIKERRNILIKDYFFKIYSTEPSV